MHRVVFTPSGLEGKVDDGTTVLEAARQLGADLDTVCGGRGICGRCQVTPSIGRFAKWRIDAEPTSWGPPATIELDYHGNRPLATGNRLGCAARIVGDVVVDVPASSQVHRQVVRKDLQLASVTVDPRFRLFFVEVRTRAARRRHHCGGGADRRHRRAASRARPITRPPAAGDRPPTARRRPRRGDGRGAQRGRPPSRHDRRRLARLRRRRLRGGDRRRLDHRRRPSV